MNLREKLGKLNKQASDSFAVTESLNNNGIVSGTVVNIHRANEVEGGGHAVSLVDRTCSCGKFQQRGYPCVHAVALAKERELTAGDYVDGVYKVSTLKSAYTRAFPLHLPSFHDLEPEGVLLRAERDPQAAQPAADVQDQALPVAGDGGEDSDQSQPELEAPPDRDGNPDAPAQAVLPPLVRRKPGRRRIRRIPSTGEAERVPGAEGEEERPQAAPGPRKRQRICKRCGRLGHFQKTCQG